MNFEKLIDQNFPIYDSYYQRPDAWNYFDIAPSAPLILGLALRVLDQPKTNLFSKGYAAIFCHHIWYSHNMNVSNKKSIVLPS